MVAPPMLNWMMAGFKANTQSWEEANPDIFKLLRGKMPLIEQG